MSEDQREESSDSGNSIDQESGVPAEEFSLDTTGLLVIDGSHTVIGSAGISGRLTELVADRGGQVTALHTDITEQVDAAVDEAFSTGDPVQFEYSPDSNEQFVFSVLPVEEFVVVQLSDMTETLGLLRELKRTKQTLDTLDDGVYTLDEAFVITSINDAVADITGYSRDELVGSHASKLAGDETLSMATEIIEQLRGSDVGLIESTIQSKSGQSIPIETRFSTVEFANGDRRRVGVFRDIRERRQHEHTLGALNRSARALLRAEDSQTVYETIVDVASTVWPDATVSAYRFDKATSRLVPVATAGTEPEAVGPLTQEWTAFATGSSVAGEPAEKSASRRLDDVSQPPSGRVIQQDADGSGDENTLYASLEEHGLLTVQFEADTSVGGAVESVELLAANAVAALGRVHREAELSQRRGELADQNSQLDRAREYNDILRRINGALVEAGSLDGIATAVCDHLVSADQIAFSWFGESYRSSDGFQLVARAGSGEGYLDGLDIVGTDPRTVTPDADAEPTARVIASREHVVVPDVSAGLHQASWRECALMQGFQSIASVPIAYDDLSYGVLSVYANQPDAFDGVLGELLQDLGDTIGNAINGLETKRSLNSESLVEVGLRIEDPDTITSRLAGAFGESVRIDGFGPGEGDSSVLYLQTDGDPEQLTDAVFAVESVRSLGGAADSRVAVTVSERTVADQLTEYGAEIGRFEATPDHLELTVVVPKSADVRLLIEALRKRYAAVELETRREYTPSEDVSQSILESLTDRQQEAVRTAYLNGYFEWPRASTGEEVADALGITQPTFNRHLRTTERKLFSALFEE